MRKFTPYIVLFLVGLVLSGFFFRNRIIRYFPKKNDFSIQDTSAVSRIEIISEDTLVISKKDSAWFVNGIAPANSVAINNFLFSFRRMEVRGINSLSGIDESKGIRLKIYEGRKLHIIRFYSIDGVAFMLKEEATKLCAVGVNGFPGIKLGEVINRNPDYWKDRTLLDLLPQDIKEIRVVHPSQPSKDFLIKVTKGDAVLFDMQGNAIPLNLTDQEKLRFYLSYFTNVFYDYSLNSEESQGQQPGWILTVTDISGTISELKVYPLATPHGPDMFKALVKFNNLSGYKVTRFMVLDLLLQDKEHFLLH